MLSRHALSSISQLRLPCWDLRRSQSNQDFPFCVFGLPEGTTSERMTQAKLHAIVPQLSIPQISATSWVEKTKYCRLIRMTLRLENQTISTVSIYDSHTSLPEILMPKNKLVQTQGVNNRLFLRPKSAHLPILRPVDWRPGSLNIYCYLYIYVYIHTHIPIYYHIYHTYIYHILPQSFFCPDVPPLVTEQQGWSPHRAKGPGGFGGPITGIPRGGTSWKHKQPHQHVYVSIIYIHSYNNVCIYIYVYVCIYYNIWICMSMYIYIYIRR